MSAIRRSWTKTVLAAAVVGSVAGTTVPAGAAADDAPGYEVIATGLHNARDITPLRNGEALVAEGGTGSPDCTAGQVAVGDTGSVYRAGGAKPRRVVTGLPSIAPCPTVPAAVSATGPVQAVPSLFGGYLVLFGGGGTTEKRAAAGEGARLLGTLYNTRTERVVADLVKYETEQDPDAFLNHPPTGNEPSSVNSNAWRFAQTPNGYLVTDAGGNDLVQVPYWGRRSTATVFPDSTTATGAAVQAVPTGIVVARNGTVYVADMGALAPSASRIWKIEPGQEPEVLVNGLTALSDLALDRSGNLVALSMTGGFQQGAPPLAGKVLRVDVSSKEVSEIDTGGRLSMAAGLAVAFDGSILVTNKATGTNGELVRITP